MVGVACVHTCKSNLRYVITALRMHVYAGGVKCSLIEFNVVNKARLKPLEDGWRVYQKHAHVVLSGAIVHVASGGKEKDSTKGLSASIICFYRVISHTMG